MPLFLVLKRKIAIITILAQALHDVCNIDLALANRAKIIPFFGCAAILKVHVTNKGANYGIDLINIIAVRCIRMANIPKDTKARISANI